MTRVLKGMAALALAGLLAGCGADGEPVQPNVSGTVTVSPDGLSAGAGVSLRKGPLSVGLAL